MTAAEQVTTFRGRPRYDGANIRTWVGFRQFMALAEEAVLAWFRERGLGPQRLYHEHGLGLTVVDSSALLPAVLQVDDEVTGEVVMSAPGRFAVTLSVIRGSERTKVLRGKVTVALVVEPESPVAADGRLAQLPEALLAVLDTVVCPHIATPPTAQDVARPSDALSWTWRARYPTCHFSDRVQHGAYVRALEEVVDRFLADRGLAVGDVLRSRGWIPVVSRARVRLVADAHMEEDVHTTFGAVDVLGDVSWEGRMDCHVRRGATLVPVAMATVLHGYAHSRGPDAGRLARLDADVLRALMPGRVTR